MSTSFDEGLRRKAETMLPAETAMLVECTADEYMDRFLSRALDHIFECGLNDEPLCDEPYMAVQTSHGALLRCEKCTELDRHGEVENTAGILKLAEDAAHSAGFPVILGVGLGSDKKTAVMAAVEALARPVDTQNTDNAIAALENQLCSRSGALHVAIEKGNGGKVCHVAVSCAYNRRA